MNVQKKVHKDAFIEIKTKVAQQTEFQTIFDELDESVVILNKAKRIVKFNQRYRKFIFGIFGESITTKVEEYTRLYERLEDEKSEENDIMKKSKGERCCSYFCCWRPNKKPKINLLDDQIRKYQHAENELLSQKIYQRFLTKAQKQEQQSQSSVSLDD